MKQQHQALAEPPVVLRFTIPRPASTKNSRRLLRRGGRLVPAKSEAASANIAQIQAAALEAINRATRGLGAGSLFGDDDIAVEVVHLVATDEVDVQVRSAGPRPNCQRTGRRSDLQNLAEGILDGVQGLAFDDDRQVVEMVMRRVVHP